MRVLIADDDLISLRVLERALDDLGYPVRVARDGEQAWTRFQEHGADVVISDWLMPGVDGLDLCRRVRGSREHGYTYFIILTGCQEMENRIIGMRAGADDYLVKPLQRGELQIRLIGAERTIKLHRRIEHQQAELRKLNDRLFREGRRDILTGIPNRLKMREDLDEMAATASRFGARYGVVIFDVDLFKRYNDRCGHAAGDETLRTVAQTLNRLCRGSDRIYRYGGEEFLALLQVETLDDARRAADRLRAGVERLGLVHPDKADGRVTVSAGVATFEGGEMDLEAVIREADAALYMAKSLGRNRTVTSADLPRMERPVLQ